MASVKAKIGWERPRKRENEIYCYSDQIIPDPQQKILKRLQKNSKNYKTPLELLFKLKQVERGQEREKLIIIVSFNSYPTRNIISINSYPTGSRKFQKNSKN